MPSRKAQQEIERNLCKDGKFATFFELRLDKNRKTIIEETKSRGCYNEVADQARRKKIHFERQKRQKQADSTKNTEQEVKSNKSSPI